MDRSRWLRVRQLIEDTGIRPILAIVPDNQDRELNVAPEDPGFWAEMREMEAGAATIAMHGYRHLCESRGKSMLNLHRHSEFAGIDASIQGVWIRSGLEILRRHGLNPRLWVAPRHGFDRNTLRALREEGLPWISDGFARMPHQQCGVTWIPQQLWSPQERRDGLWTICLHPATTSDAYLQRLHAFIDRHCKQFPSFDRVVSDFEIKNLGLGEALYAGFACWRVQRRHKHA
jgi:predicted deacetylase